MYENVSTNPDCLDPISLQVQRLGALYTFFGFLGVFVFMSLLTFWGLAKKSQEINNKIKSHPWTLYEVFEDKDES
jgi:hypothetical protein